MPRRVLRNVLITIVLSRALVFFFLVIGSQIAFLGKEYDNAIWRTEIDLSLERVRPELTRMVMVGDAWFYERIARDGYERPGGDGKPKNTWAFFPLFPLLVRTPDFALGAMVLSNLAFAAGLLLVAATGLRFGATEDEVERAVFFLAFFPTSYFFSLPMTEALFLCLSAASFYFAGRGQWWAAGVAGTLAASTRFVGVLLLPALLFLPVKNAREKAWLLLIPAGTGAFMLYLQRLTGDPLAFVHAQTLWGRGAWQSPFAISRPRRSSSSQRLRCSARSSGPSASTRCSRSRFRSAPARCSRSRATRWSSSPRFCGWRQEPKRASAGSRRSS